ncbi:GAF and ANTAR domain-containing protein [Streptomyces sp. NPDC017529]|uniref:GAF and ANTAR domain-containing protein n=1 Tax=Streptomyces sp. NPDC017529 TaxID=3365000 RepID=UPI0037AA64C3
MGANRDLAAVLESLHPASGDPGLIGADPRLCAQVLRVDGVAVSVTTGSGLSELLWSTPGASTRLEDLQYELGQGPGPEAAASCAPVLAPDLSRVPTGRWPTLLPQLTELGIGAVFCFPLAVGSACLGTLSLQRATSGPLPDSTMTDAWLVANALTAVLLQGGPQQHAFAAAEEGSDFYRAAVHQASGMISVQAGTTLAQALLRLRAHAFRHGRPVTEVAEDVVARRLHFRDDENGPDTAAGEGTEGP